MKKLLLGTAIAIGMATASALVTPAAARVDFSIGVGPFVIDSEHDRCYDYWFRVRHPRFCYYSDYDEDWWDHHHRGWDHHRHDRDDWDDHHRHHHDRDDWDDRHHHDHDHDRDHRDRDHDHRDHDHDHDHHDHDHDHHDHDHHEH